VALVIWPEFPAGIDLPDIQTFVLRYLFCF